MTYLVLALTILLTLFDAHAERRADYWFMRTYYARTRGIESPWYKNASVAWHRQYAFWSNVQKFADLLKLLSLVVLLVTVAAA